MPIVPYDGEKPSREPRKQRVFQERRSLNPQPSLKPEYQSSSLIEQELIRFSQAPGAYALFIDYVRTGNAIDARTLERQLIGTNLVGSPLIERFQGQNGYGLNSSAVDALRSRLGESVDQIDRAIELAEQRVGKGTMRDIAGALRLGTEHFPGRQVRDFQNLGVIPDHPLWAKYHLVYPLQGGRIRLFTEYAFPIVARNMIAARYR